jgi:hypothetical protein
MLKCKSCFVVPWSSLFGDKIGSSANLVFVVLWSSPFGDIIDSSANLVSWSCGLLHSEI